MVHQTHLSTSTLPSVDPGTDYTSSPAPWLLVLPESALYALSASLVGSWHSPQYLAEDLTQKKHWERILVNLFTLP